MLIPEEASKMFGFYKKGGKLDKRVAVFKVCGTMIMTLAAQRNSHLVRSMWMFGQLAGC